MRVSIARALVTAPAAPADGRALRGARRDHALQASTTTSCACRRELGCTVVFVTHSVFESVYLSNRIVVMAARPGRVVAELADRRALPARRGLPRPRRAISSSAAWPRDALARAPCGPDEHAASQRPTAADDPAEADDARPAGARPRSRILRVRRSPAVVLAIGLLVAWETYVRSRRRPALHPARARADRRDARQGLAVLSASLARDACRRRSWALRSPSSAASGSRSCSPVAGRRVCALSLRRRAAGDAGPRHRAAPADLHAAGRRRVLTCAWIVAFFPILSNTTLGLRSVDHNLLEPVRALRRRRRWQKLLATSSCAARPALFPGRPEDRRRPVADRRGRGRDRGRLGGRGLRPRLPHHREPVPAQHPAPLRRPDAALRRRASSSSSRCRSSRISSCATGTRARCARES